MSIESQAEREEEYLSEALACGTISQKEYNRAMRDLQRDVRSAIQEEAQQAYDNVMDYYR